MASFSSATPCAATPDGPACFTTDFNELCYKTTPESVSHVQPPYRQCSLATFIDFFHTPERLFEDYKLIEEVNGGPAPFDGERAVLFHRRVQLALKMSPVMCTLCDSPIVSGNTFLPLLCKHRYHTGCLLVRLEEGYRHCPQCGKLDYLRLI